MDSLDTPDRRRRVVALARALQAEARLAAERHVPRDVTSAWVLWDVESRLLHYNQFGHDKPVAVGSLLQRYKLDRGCPIFCLVSGCYFTFRDWLAARQHLAQAHPRQVRAFADSFIAADSQLQAMRTQLAQPQAEVRALEESVQSLTASLLTDAVAAYFATYHQDSKPGPLSGVPVPTDIPLFSGAPPPQPTPVPVGPPSESPASTGTSSPPSRKSGRSSDVFRTTSPPRSSARASLVSTPCSPPVSADEA